MCRFRLVGVIVGTLLFYLVFAGTASAQVNSADGIKNPTVTTVHGVPLEGGGCSYSGTIAMSPNSNAVRQKPIYQDSASCTMVVEQGEPVTRKISGRPGAQSRGSSATANSRNLAAAYLYNYNSTAHLRTWLEDSANADVNQVTSYINWWWKIGRAHV